jgi:hypothetical protein
VLGPSGGATTYSFDAPGNLTSTFSASYNAKSQPLSMTSSGTSKSFSYAEPATPSAREWGA